MTSAPPPAPPPSLDPPPWGPPPPSEAPPRAQLRRSRSDKVVSGVSGGLADYTGIDPLLWRVGFVALTFAGGFGVLAYALLWLLMPVEPAGAPQRTPRAARSARPREPRSPVPGITIAVLLIVLGLLALVTTAGGWDPGPRVFLGTAVLVVGLGLVASAFTGTRRGRRGLIILGAVLSVMLFSTSTYPDGNGVGERTYRPTTAADIRPVYELGVGDLRVDLSDVDLADLDDPIRTRIEQGIGDLDVLVPRSADVRITVDQGVGDVRAFGSDDALDGQLVPGEGSAPWTGDGRAEFVIDVDFGIGDVEVSRA